MAPEENESGMEKTESATPRRRQKTREKGSVARSKEVNSAAMLFFGLIVFALYGPYVVRQLIENVRYTFSHFPEIEISENSILKYASDNIWFLFKLVLPIFAVFIFVGVLVNITQFGWLYTKQTIFQGLKNFNLNPIKQIKKMFDVNSLVMLAIDMVKMFVLIMVVYKTLKNEIPKFPSLVSIPISEAVHYISILLFKLSLKIIIFLILIGIIDFFWQRHKYEKSMKMTKVEIKEEMKSIEGDPKIKSQIKAAQMKMVISAMVQKVPEADVVITNPFHLAVALKYDPKIMQVPTVIAKGARLIAERIKDAARNASVPIVENKPLAQTIYKTIDVGQEIPPNLYQAVAEVLAYVHKLNEGRANVM